MMTKKVKVTSVIYSRLGVGFKFSVAVNFTLNRILYLVPLFRCENGSLHEKLWYHNVATCIATVAILTNSNVFSF